jgi:hypothetical protein
MTLSIATLFQYSECPCAERRYAKCRYAQCRSAKKFNPASVTQENKFSNDYHRSATL